jgi:molybdopterin-guanine dinucleotide biosynthesis protein A
MANIGITGVVLAGGEARRMGGGDKGLVELCGRPLVEYALGALSPQVDTVIINANRNREIYAAYGYPVIPDSRRGFQGPLAGMLSCLQEAETEFVVTVPCDSPLLPDDLVARMFRQLSEEQADISVAHNGDRMQPVFTLMPTSLASSMQAFLDGGGRKIDRWFERHKLAVTDFSDNPECFRNINNPAELAQMEAQLNGPTP